MAPAFDAGWRGQAFGWAALGAAAPARRAFRAEAVGYDQSDLETQLLAALAMPRLEGDDDPGATADGLANTLAVDRQTVTRARRGLAEAGLIEPGPLTSRPRTVGDGHRPDRTQAHAGGLSNRGATQDTSSRIGPA